MARITGRVRRVRRRLGERGAQSLEWIALGTAVATMMTGATIYARDHGGDIGSVLVSHLKGVVGQ